MILKKIISGGQNGADQGALEAAKLEGLLVGGCMPKGFKTLDGDKPKFRELYNMYEHSRSDYPARTYENVKNADATLRLALDFNSSGELCTYNAISYYEKLYFDVKFNFSKRPYWDKSPEEIATILHTSNVEILNVAGNSNRVSPYMQDAARTYVQLVIRKLKGMLK